MDEVHELYADRLSIPLELFRDPDLSLREGLFISFLHALSVKEGYCWASNKYLAEAMRVSEQHIINMLTKLKKEGWVWDIGVPGAQRRLVTRLKSTLKPTPKNRLDSTEKSVRPHRKIGSDIYSENDLRKEEETALTIFRKIYPDFLPSAYQQDLLEQQATDLVKWKSTVEFWASNGYQPRSIGKMIDKYLKDLEVAKQPAAARVIINDFDRCPSCENGFKDQCKIHGGTNGRA